MQQGQGPFQDGDGFLQDMMSSAKSPLLLQIPKQEGRRAV